MEDCWHNDYTDAPVDGRAWLSGCDSVRNHLLRGGSWFDGSEDLRSAYRNKIGLREQRGNFDGFRIARTLEP